MDLRHTVTEQSLNRGLIKSPHVAIVFEIEAVFKCFFAQTLRKDTSDLLFIEPIVTNI